MTQERMAEAGTAVGADAITPQLVRQVADRVYALWLKDLRTERERRRLRAVKFRRRPY